MKGLYFLKLYGRTEYYKIINGIEHIIVKNKKGKYEWCKTILAEDRWKKLKPITDIDLILMLKEK